MKTNQQVADMFADGELKGSSGHMFIEGNTIYSYGHHFAIATRYVPNSFSNPVFFFTEAGYSNTTSKHKGRVWQALQAAGYEVLWSSDGFVPSPTVILEKLEENQEALSHTRANSRKQLALSLEALRLNKCWSFCYKEVWSDTDKIVNENAISENMWQSFVWSKTLRQNIQVLARL